MQSEALCLHQNGGIVDFSVSREGKKLPTEIHFATLNYRRMWTVSLSGIKRGT